MSDILHLWDSCHFLLSQASIQSDDIVSLYVMLVHPLNKHWYGRQEGRDEGIEVGMLSERERDVT